MVFGPSMRYFLAMINLRVAALGIMLAAVEAVAQVPIAAPEQQLSRHELHDLDRLVSVQIRIKDDPGKVADRGVGSGVWISNRYVVTCEHVIRGAAPNSITISFPQQGGYYNEQSESSWTGSLLGLSAEVVFTDDVADIAILQLTNIVQGLELGYPIAFVKMADSLPEIGTETVLMGFPLGDSDLLTQFGNVGGVSSIVSVTGDSSWSNRWFNETRGFPLKKDQSEAQRLTADTIRLDRVLVSVVSNPGNSGGPVFDDKGFLIGLLEGNQSVPARKSDGLPQIVMAPFEVGGLIVGVDGRTESEKDFMAQIDSTFKPVLTPKTVFENTGISYVVPAPAIAKLLRRCELEGKCHTGPLPYALGHFGPSRP
jgi:S1-C subfamily serine protease